MKQILFYILFSLFTCLTICAEPYTPESLPNVFDRTIKESRKEYNEAVQKYNVSVRRFPSNIIANTCGFEKKVPFQAAEGAEKAPDLKGAFDK